LIYFVYHIFNGKYGIYSYIELKKQLYTKGEELKEINAKNKIMESKIKNLKQNNLDIDLLEEELKRKLNFSFKDEIIIKLN
jgi:cell division protein FtsB